MRENKGTVGKVLVVAGLLFILVSIYPIYTLNRESALVSEVYSRYNVEQVVDIRNGLNQTHILSGPFKWEDNVLEVVATDTGVEPPKRLFNKKMKHIVKISIKINGKEVSFPTEAWLPPKITGDSDYLGWINVVNITDASNNQNQIAIIQCLTVDQIEGENIQQHTQSQKWRILYVDKDKKVTEEVFSYPERGDHLLGVMLVQLSSLSSTFIGFESDKPYSLPSYVYPRLYPTGTCLVGIVLLIVGLYHYVRNRLYKKRRYV